MGYLSNFIVYMLAMVGVMMFALLVFKHTTGCGIKKSAKTNGLKVIDTLSLTTRKTLYVIEAGGEKFLIAGDIDRTTLISKLDEHNTLNSTIAENFSSNNQNNFETGAFTVRKNGYNSVIKSLAEKIRG